MPSPFPGMNPYLEHADVWQDFHQSFIPLLRQVLSEQVRPKYLVKIEEQIFIHELTEDQRQLVGRGDMTVSRSDADSAGTAVVLVQAGSGAVPQPAGAGVPGVQSNVTVMMLVPSLPLVDVM